MRCAGVDLFVVFKRLLVIGEEQGANELMQIELALQEMRTRLREYAAEVKAGQVNRDADKPGVEA